MLSLTIKRYSSMWRHWSRLRYFQNKPAGDQNGPCGQPGARGHHVGDPWSKWYWQVLPADPAIGRRATGQLPPKFWKTCSVEYISWV